MSNNNTRWTQDEELKLIKDISGGASFNNLSDSYGRSADTIELRFKRIIYDNVSNGKSIEDISTVLGIGEDKLRQYYYSYKDFLEKKGGGGNNTNINIDNKDNIIPISHGGGHKSNHKIKDKLKRLEYENKIMKLFLENEELTHKLNKLIKNGKLDKSIKDYIKSLRNA